MKTFRDDLCRSKVLELDMFLIPLLESILK